MPHPDLYLFNPTCEMAIANGTISYQPPARLQQFEHDIAAIMLFAANTNDVVVVHDYPSQTFCSTLHEAGIPIPKFKKFNAIISDTSLSLGTLKPWGWSPAMHHKLNLLRDRSSANFLESTVSIWKPEHRHFYSRHTSVNCALMASELLKASKSELLEIPAIPIKITSVQQIDKLLYHFNNRLVLKAPWSSSGRGVTFITPHTNYRINKQWIEGIIKHQGLLLAEPYLEKQLDISFHFFVMPNGSIQVLGHTFFSTDEKGKFKGCYTAEYPGQLIESKQLLLIKEAIAQAIDVLHETLKQLNPGQYYTGPIGIDGMFFINNEGKLRLHPAIEVNIRHSMGYLNLQIRKLVHPDSNGFWQIKQINDAHDLQLLSTIESGDSLLLKDNCLLKGMMPLTPVNVNSLFQSWLTVEPLR
jgi:hypothetical protein